MLTTPSAVADRNDTDRARRQTGAFFRRRDGSIELVHVAGRRSLWISDEVWLCRDYASEVQRAFVAQGIDPHTYACTRRAPACEQSGSQRARFVAARWGREVFEILDQDVGAAQRHRCVRTTVRAGAEEPGAQQRPAMFGGGHR
jgi:hypothetical protein